MFQRPDPLLDYLQQPGDEPLGGSAAGQYGRNAQIASSLGPGGIPGSVQHDHGHPGKSRPDHAQQGAHPGTQLHVRHDDVRSMLDTAAVIGTSGRVGRGAATRQRRCTGHRTWQLVHIVRFEGDVNTGLVTQCRQQRGTRKTLWNEQTNTDRLQPGHTSCRVLPGGLGRWSMAVPPSFNPGQDFPSSFFDESTEGRILQRLRSSVPPSWHRNRPALAPCHPREFRCEADLARWTRSASIR